MRSSNPSKSKRVLVICPYPHGSAGSQRYRFELFFDVLREEGCIVDQQPFIDAATWRILYSNGNYLRKVAGTLRGFMRRVACLLSISTYDVVFLHREAAPFGPPVFEWLIARLFRKRIIYDFDDAIWKRDTSSANRLIGWLKAPGKVGRICRMASVVSVGNAFLAEYAGQFSDSVRIIPTVVDTENRHNRLKDHSAGPVNIGWTGSYTTLKYLDMIAPQLKALENRFDFQFIVIADKRPKLDLKSLKFVPWNNDREVEDLLRFNIGLMPLEDDKWAKGKCGFKLIQYLSLGIPAVASPVGVNAEIITDGETGYTFNSGEEFTERLSTLLEDRERLAEMGRKGRELIVRKYSKQAVQADFLQLFH